MSANMKQTSNRESCAGIDEHVGRNGGVSDGVSDSAVNSGINDKTHKMVFICSPYRPKSEDPEKAAKELSDNIAMAKAAVKLAASVGAIGMAPHLYFPQIFGAGDHDEAIRQQGMMFGREWLINSSEVWVIGREMSEGMLEELQICKDYDIPVYCIPDPRQSAEELLKVLDSQRE